ncbi:hypothetical protein H0H81_008518 [Sphagnurus paluster]|uniref:NAD(P)-binding protein n=1 Tax=Sphagnurus paluster TaxID=117069 RepID=A0A9P7FSK9_9AGAR|nr:hypothetical protein H0H81_008518 [Sphagnurus paluster]
MSSPTSSVGVAIVTGAARGIGRGIALRLARDGYDVGINDISSSAEALNTLAKEIVTIGRNSCVAIGDVSIAEDVENMVSTVVEKLGQLNVMVANAGICRFTPILETDVSEWENMFAVNTRGVFLSYKYAALQMIKQGKGGMIIGACSIAGLKGALSLSFARLHTSILDVAFLGHPNMAAYSASKFAVRGLTQVAAQEWGSHGIRVNAYSPGAIDTPMIYEVYGEMVNLPEFAEKARNLSDIIENSKKSCALGYTGTPAEIASIVSYLVSNEAHFITEAACVYDQLRLKEQ